MTTVACAPLAPRIGEPAHNRALAAEAVARAAAAGAEVLVLPELCTSGYVFADADEAGRFAEPLDGPAVREWRDLSARHGLVLVAGLCEARGDGRPGNSAVVLDHGELVAVHRKTHLWDREKLMFAAGEEPSPVVATSAGRLGLAICYDAFFPEVMRALALAGAELIVVPANVPVLEPVLEPLPAEVVTAVAAAVQNRVCVAQCDRAGDERGVRWVGASAIIDADGRLLAQGGELLVADVDLDRTRDKCWNERNDALADRRPELYGPGSPAEATTAP